MQVNKNHLSTTVAAQVDAARTGVQALESAQGHLATMQECYRVRLSFLDFEDLKYCHPESCKAAKGKSVF